MSVNLPKLNHIRTRQEGVTAFGGLNHNLRIKDNEFFDMQNMTGKWLPVMQARNRRRLLRQLDKANGIFAHEEICWVDGSEFVYGGEVKGSLTDGEKQFVRMGAYVLIWPDKAYYNTHTDEFGNLGAKKTVAARAEICKLDGTAYEVKHTGAEPPEDPAGGDIWIDTSDAPAVLKEYSDMSEQWVSIPTVYSRITADGIGAGFAKNDGIDIQGFDSEELTGTHYLVDVSDDALIVVALLTAPMEAAAVTLERKIPDMEFIVEHENRLWGCSSATHEIYASALGDPKNWHQYIGLASDSYAVTVGSTGAFTGAASHLGFVMFFKETCCHQILGSKPANYQLSTSNLRGIAAGSEKSLVRVGETLYYHAGEEVCAYNSALPSSISRALGNDRYHAGVGGALGSVYYLSLAMDDGGRVLFTYDTKNGVWLKEDTADVQAFAQLNGDLIMLDYAGRLWSMSGKSYPWENGAMPEADVEWMLETGDIGFERQAAQYVGGIQLHAQCDAKSSFAVRIQYDGCGDWHLLLNRTVPQRQSMTIPITPRRARLIRLRISGRGDFRLYSMTMRIETGSDQYANW